MYITPKGDSHESPFLYFDILALYMTQKVTRTDEKLWALCKQEAVESMGKFSARAMQRAVVLYKERGGGYIGTKSKTNPLVAWNKKQQIMKDVLGNES